MQAAMEYSGTLSFLKWILFGVIYTDFYVVAIIRSVCRYNAKVHFINIESSTKTFETRCSNKD